MRVAEAVWKQVWQDAWGALERKTLSHEPSYLEVSLEVQNPVDDEVYYGVCLLMRDGDRLLE